MTKQKPILFDSCAFIHFFNGSNEAKVWITKVLNKSIIGEVSPITDFELWVWNPNKKQDKEYRVLLSRFKRVNFHAEIARTAASIYRQVPKNQRTKALVPDSFLAATALYSKADILTNNIKHFELFNLPGVVLIDYLDSVGRPETSTG